MKIKNIALQILYWLFIAVIPLALLYFTVLTTSRQFIIDFSLDFNINTNQSVTKVTNLAIIPVILFFTFIIWPRINKKILTALHDKNLSDKIQGKDFRILTIIERLLEYIKPIILIIATVMFVNTFIVAEELFYKLGTTELIIGSMIIGFCIEVLEIMWSYTKEPQE